MSGTVCCMATEPRIGTRLKRARERLRMSQADVADALGVSRSAVNAWETDRAYPRSAVGALEQLLSVRLTDEPGEMDALREEVRSMRAEMERLAEALERRNTEDDTQAKHRAAG